jgi:branched-chain amino acid transport system substrate-binding protein
MSKRLFVTLSLLAIAGLVLVACVPPRPPFEPPTDPIGVVKIPPGEPIHIAYWLVVAGPDASLGEDSKRGIEIAIDDMGGKLLGRPIKLTGEDSGCNAEGGIAAATKLSTDPTIVGLIGSSCSSEAAAGVPILSKAGYVTISPSNTRPHFTMPEQRKPGGPLHVDFAGYLRTAHSDAVQGAVAAQFAWEVLKAKKAATIHDGSPYAEALQQVFADKFKEFGGTITSQEAVSPTDVDMRAVLTKIAADKPDVIYYPIFIAAGAHITKQAREIPDLDDTALMGADGMFSPDFVAGAGPAAEGVYLSSPDFTAFAAGYEDFRKKHKEKYGEDVLSIFHAHAYDAAMILFKAIEKVAVTAPDGTIYIGRQALRDALFATKDHQGLTGVLSCDPYGDCSAPLIAIYQITAREVGGQWPPEKPVWKP